MTTTSLAKVAADPDGRRAVAELFTEPDFFFRSTIPDLLCAAELHALVPGDALLCRRGARPAGLIWFEPVAAGYPAHFQLHVRFSRACGTEVAAEATRRALRELAAGRPLHRISHEVGAADRCGVDLAGALGLDLEGAVPDLVAAGGGRGPRNYYAKLYREHEDA
ncbi:hypothetical protein [Amycolatopsis sp. PS_44_ISF1]|uniref:hypothetical protein n=1 Tax=Amycolatopsis sp. PS_44_ISF1 TaxID=2974917 RepID=UPI0028DF5514|nr:hypothetical protein [Amycolatopsis sp. PS_44_ISF1]MDT8912947.1 hypothetical protein [Amycolatopsis sp. PS_44_ISF1]